jgi:hypothetical protein
MQGGKEDDSSTKRGKPGGRRCDVLAGNRLGQGSRERCRKLLQSWGVSGWQQREVAGKRERPAQSVREMRRWCVEGTEGASRAVCISVSEAARNRLNGVDGDRMAGNSAASARTAAGGDGGAGLDPGLLMRDERRWAQMNAAGLQKLP